MSDSDDVLSNDEPLPSGPDAQDTEAAVDQILSAGGAEKWITNEALQLTTKRWRPYAVNVPKAKSKARRCILHVCLTKDIPQHIASRMGEAFACNFRVQVGLNIDALYSPSTLKALADADADVIVLSGSDRRRLRPRHFLAAIADLGVPTPPEIRVDLGKRVFERIRQGTDQEKGRRFEALLAFLLSQVQDFRVVDRNLRTASQELDMVIQIDHHSQRSWQQQVPYLLVEAKNWSKPVGQPIVSHLMIKIRTKGQSCKMGLLITSGRFTRDAGTEEVRYSESENRIALIDGTNLKSLIEAWDLDDCLDEIVRHARMR